ncbi:hypothetical protein B0J17DRAFT_724242 [Rhizoctonia solani]|nr:hypothetical protein B0J17DRAFT_724242 [Rhizoctonia solani]
MAELKERVSVIQGRAEAIEKIWPSVERANRISPTHSFLDKQAVILVNPSHSLPRTPEGNISYPADSRPCVPNSEGVHPSHERVPRADAVIGSHRSRVGSSSDEVWTSENVGNQRTVDQEPATRRLTQLPIHLSPPDGLSVNSVPEALHKLYTMIRKYDSDWPRQEVCIVQPVLKERIVVTGTTGALGSHLLAQLLESDGVEKVWAMNRKSSKGNTRGRQMVSFEDKMLDLSLLNNEKLKFVDADLADPKLDLHNGVYDEANSDLQSFEPNICGTRHLLDLAFSSTASTGLPRFVFTSSITVAGFTSPGRRLKEVPVALEEAATSIGYGQSKLVSEKLLESARCASLQTCTVRLGQLAGDIKSGSWSTTDWVPSLIGSSISVGCLPGATGGVSWLPLDVAAHSIIDICTARDAELPAVVHVSHPRSVPWMDIINAFSMSIIPYTGSQLPVIRFDEWNKRVVEAAKSFKGSKNDRYKRFPITKIQRRVDRAVQVDHDLHSSGDAANAEFGGLVSLDTTIAETCSESLRSTPKLGTEHVEQWVEYWNFMGFFKSV